MIQARHHISSCHQAFRYQKALNNMPPNDIVATNGDVKTAKHMAGHKSWIHRLRSLFTAFLLGILFFSVTDVFAQPSGNEWIDYDQTYYRIPVTQDGMIRITYNQLINSGFPADEIDPRWIQLFHEGEEQYIYIEGEGSNGIFDPNGYLEFYGQRNRGENEAILYDDPQNQINPDHSLFTDTAVYFLTWNNQYDNRRMQSEDDLNFAAHSDNQAMYCIRHLRNNYTGFYYPASSRAMYTRSEAWLDNAEINLDESRTKNINLTNKSGSGSDVEIELAVAGTPSSSIQSSIPHHLKVDFMGSTRVNEIYSGYDYIRKSFTFASADVPESIDFVFSSNDTQSPQYDDDNRVSYIDITYPHTMDFQAADAFEFYLPSGGGSKDYLEISDFGDNSTVWLYDLDQHLRIKTSRESGLVKALVPDNNSSRHMIICNQNGYNQPHDIRPAAENGQFTRYTALNPGADYLIVTHSSLASVAETYKAYRNTTGYNAEVFIMDELYDQYAHGIRKHPYAIRGLVQDYTNLNGVPPKQLFLLGKGIKTSSIRNGAAISELCFVPTFGNPPSDVLITAGMGDTHFEPFVPTGRLAARNPGDVEDYLTKIQAYESTQNALWMKNILHFGGGANAGEQASFASYLQGYENTIEDTLFGGFVHTFLKNSSAPIQISVSDSVRNLINNGVSMMTFFGHASASGFDQNIDDPENYNNQDRYPFILANSCFSGDIHDQGNASVSERWIRIADKGAIAFMASVGSGYGSFLNRFSGRLYESITYLHYGESLGKQQQEATRLAQEGSLNDITMQNTFHEMTLHGDPALRINHADLPDLQISSADINFEPSEITTLQDSFLVNIHMTNPGRAFADTFLVRLERQYADNTVESYEKAVEGCLYDNNLQIKLPVKPEIGTGLNRITVKLDFYNQIEELSETNNQASLQFLVKSASVYPVYPFEYAIYPDNTVELKASTGDPFVGETNYLFEMDTTDMFSSNMGLPLYSGESSASGGVISWSPQASLEENRVYYWRVAADHPVPDSISWEESSFIHIPGKTGWSQAHPYQFKKDDYEFIEFDRDERDFDFVESARQLQCHNIGSPSSAEFESIRFTIDGAINNGDGDGGSCLPSSGMHIVVIDPVTIKAWPGNIADYGQSNYPMCEGMGRPNFFFKFPSGDSLYRQNMIDMISNEVPDGHYILAYSFRNGNFENWAESEYQGFENIGATNIRNVENNVPYAFFTQKGEPGSEQEVTGNSTTDVIDLYADLYSKFNYGTITSTAIGPASEWISFHWYQEAMEENNDLTQVELLSYQPAENNTSVLDTITTATYDIYNLQPYIDAGEHPWLKLNFRTRDDSTKTPGQIKKWQIMHEGIPETAINPKSGFYISGDTISRGEELQFALATENISPYDMDSLLVKSWIQTSDNQIISLGERRLRPHPAGDVLTDTIICSTTNLQGLNSIWVEFNPLTESGDYDQAERYHFNNIAQYYFYVATDNANPLLDVTFDGVHILDGDIVSAEPEILVSLKDENPYLALNDTSLFRVYLTNMQTGLEKRVHFRDSMGNEVLQWMPAELPENKSKILYEPEFTKDGKYQLRIQATDVSGNESGDNDYIISFEVITKSSITNVLNYPNPFSTSTRFVFELTGSVIPDKFRIEVYTLTGRLVKVIDKAELGPIHIGRNITEYAWDGRDMYGDQLANGVYFYRIKTEIAGENIEHRSNESDTYFEKNIGKMYLMR
ncbi:MAG: C25 family cysteine peptidase [Bacteroidota bacterium]